MSKDKRISLILQLILYKIKKTFTIQKILIFLWSSWDIFKDHKLFRRAEFKKLFFKHIAIFLHISSTVHNIINSKAKYQNVD